MTVEFSEWKKKNAKIKANHANPWMGLDGKTCTEPVYWCRLHEVWLSESDVERKKCLAKLSYNMMETYKCKCLERKNNNPFIEYKKC